jgi:predicted acyltransferase
VIDGTTLLGLSVAAAAALVIAGVWLLRQPGGNRTKAVLMMVAGVVILFNGWLGSLPLPAQS